MPVCQKFAQVNTYPDSASTLEQNESNAPYPQKNENENFFYKIFGVIDESCSRSGTS